MSKPNIKKINKKKMHTISMNNQFLFNLQAKSIYRKSLVSKLNKNHKRYNKLAKKFKGKYRIKKELSKTSKIKKKIKNKSKRTTKKIAPKITIKVKPSNKRNLNPLNNSKLKTIKKTKSKKKVFNKSKPIKNFKKKLSPFQVYLRKKKVVKETLLTYLTPSTKTTLTHAYIMQNSSSIKLRKNLFLLKVNKRMNSIKNIQKIVGKYPRIQFLSKRRRRSISKHTKSLNLNGVKKLAFKQLQKKRLRKKNILLAKRKRLKEKTLINILKFWMKKKKIKYSKWKKHNTKWERQIKKHFFKLKNTYLRKRFFKKILWEIYVQRCKEKRFFKKFAKMTLNLKHLKREKSKNKKKRFVKKNVNKIKLKKLKTKRSRNLALKKKNKIKNKKIKKRKKVKKISKVNRKKQFKIQRIKHAKILRVKFKLTKRLLRKKLINMRKKRDDFKTQLNALKKKKPNKNTKKNIKKTYKTIYAKCVKLKKKILKTRKMLKKLKLEKKILIRLKRARFNKKKRLYNYKNNKKYSLGLLNQHYKKPIQHKFKQYRKIFNFKEKLNSLKEVYNNKGTNHAYKMFNLNKKTRPEDNRIFQECCKWCISNNDRRNY